MHADLPGDKAMFAEFDRVEVSVLRNGAIVALPPAPDRCSILRRVIESPRTFRPTGLGFVEVIPACANGQQRQPVRALSNA
ncbi:hypothetical protein [Nocardia pseudovaccinii]|uniref:hypothetical protein n=1 Tax=Nocardia pseudovaccinii TaxID=189540 RepID=UPI0007A42472|nr:hypothetical protein [Nocardia pseudovaccinii]